MDIRFYVPHSDGEMETELLLVDAHMKPGVWSLSMQDQAMWVVALRSIVNL